MISQYGALPPLLIPNGSNVSNIYQGVYVYHDAIGLQVQSPTVLLEAVYFEVNREPDATSSTAGWVPYETFDVDGNSINLFVPGPGKSQTYQEVIFAGSLRLKSTTNVAGDRTFLMNKLYTV